MRTLSVEDYYREINAFFDIIERKYNRPVVIAAHPKAFLYKKADYFNGRKFFFNATVCLSKYAEFIITHYSTAISYPIIFKKPILFVYTDELKCNMPNHYDYIIYLSKMLHSNVVNANSDNLEIPMLSVEDSVYDDYSRNYIYSKEVKGIMSSVLLIDFLKNR